MKKFLFVSLLVSTIFSLQAQYLEVGGFAGVSMYSGDLQFQIIEVKESNLAFGAFARYNFTHRISAKAHFYSGTISGKDQNSNNPYVRNLHFQSDIKEIGLQGEFNLLPEGWNMSERMAIYAFTGISGFRYNPRAIYDEKWVDLQPLGTEGQGMEGEPEKYKLHQFAIPLGVGIKVFTNEFANVGFEMGMRKTFTDYLDDVSTDYPNLQALGEENPTAAALSYRGNHPNKASRVGKKRGNPDKKDWYFFSGITVSINLFGYATTGSNEYNGIFY